MSEYEVRVIGAPSPKKPKGQYGHLRERVRGTIRAVLLRPRAAMLAGLAGFVVLVGTPHAGWDYECRYPMRSGRPCRSVSYCAYYGIQGRRIMFPKDGESCKLITFLPPDWGKLIGELEWLNS